MGSENESATFRLEACAHCLVEPGVYCCRTGSNGKERNGKEAAQTAGKKASFTVQGTKYPTTRNGKKHSEVCGTLCSSSVTLALQSCNAEFISGKNVALPAGDCLPSFLRATKGSRILRDIKVNHALPFSQPFVPRLLLLRSFISGRTSKFSALTPWL
jgi:hypothetical protein